MRTEKDIYELILDIARKDDRIVAVYMNGSRTNPNAPRDIFQDYDIVYVVGETGSFVKDKDWINQFGDIMYMQYPDESPFYPSDKEHRYGWLMQFKDGNRIDLTVQTLEYAKKHISDDKLCNVLLDKENVLPIIEESTDSDYHVKRPTQEQFSACCNEFWWCSNNLAKGLWREEITYVQDMTNFVVRKQLERILAWKVGIVTDFSVSVGKSAKYMNRWLEKEIYENYLRTYFIADVEAAWKSIFIMCDLFDKMAIEVANDLEYSYNHEEAKMARTFLEDVNRLPKDAVEIY
ncbi:aminoglycoside 6-adenylyltransferase [Anaerosporobacter faecicola]|uniref:aminoglycoside 6-adenylyltransferase n=1 Tax=Anaerosporobacter faecicola TaxID=2718714 RepID=UPI0014398387|nr:aminoglycoside 6-adenylyltransferase [Anaerosporobacter faecicola]